MGVINLDPGKKLNFKTFTLDILVLAFKIQTSVTSTSFKTNHDLAAIITLKVAACAHVSAQRSNERPSTVEPYAIFITSLTILQSSQCTCGLVFQP